MRRPPELEVAGHFDTSAAYKAACDLVFKGLAQPSGIPSRYGTPGG